MTAPAVPPSAAGGPAHRCALCGCEFDTGVEKCAGCPMHAGCGTVCCPRCGYSFVEESATVTGLKRLGRTLRRLLTGSARNAKEIS